MAYVVGAFNLVSYSARPKETLMIHRLSYLGFMIVMLLNLIPAAPSEVKVVIEQNDGRTATGNFRFKNIPAPAKDDVGATAKLTLVVGAKDSNSAGLSALTDGLLPHNEDEARA